MDAVKTFFSSPLGEVIKETARWAILGFISQLVLNLTTLNQTTDVVILTSLLRFVDSALHKSNIAQKGLVRF